MTHSMVMTKVPEYPRPHETVYNFAIPVESASLRTATICPILTYDEGLGVINSYKSNPQATGFAESASDHCYPTSRINRVFAELRVSMSKIMLETDKVHQIRFATATIHCAFEDGDAEDEISTLDLGEILEIQKETTDRQTYPIYNAVDLADYKSNAGLDMPAEQLGLDTDLEIEAIAFSADDYYDCLHYYTNGAKLRKICTQLKWHTLTRQKPYTVLHFQQQENTKFMNPYAFLAALIVVPTTAQFDQYGKAADTTVETSTLEFVWHTRFNEFNHEFNHSLQ